MAAALGAFHPFLLYGVTGSGKTAVYLAAMQRALDRGLASILLVPEIGLTPQTVGLLDAAFGEKVALLHSALTPEERSEQWRRIRAGRGADCGGDAVGDLCAGAESGADSGGRGARPELQAGGDAALQRARCGGDARQAGGGGGGAGFGDAVAGELAELRCRASMRASRCSDRVMNRPLPEVELIDMRREFQETGKEQLFSRSLIEQTKAALERGEQALILLNRRGYSFAVICRACGEKLECENCAIALTHHKPAADDGGDCAGGAAAGVPLLRLSADGAGAMPEVRQRASCTTWARGRSRARSGWRRFFRARGSGAWIATRCAGATIWSGCWRGCTRARSICWWARR